MRLPVDRFDDLAAFVQKFEATLELFQVKIVFANLKQNLCVSVWLLTPKYFVSSLLQLVQILYTTLVSLEPDVDRFQIVRVEPAPFCVSKSDLLF